MASDAEDHCHDDDHDATTVTISQVYVVKVGKTAWYPDVQTADGTVYFKPSKHDRVLAKLVLGKGMNRHKKKGEILTISNKAWWSEMQVLRKQTCDRLYVEMMRQTMEQAGAVVPENHGFRKARDEDRYLFKTSQVPLPVPALEDHDAMIVNALWLTKGDLWLELTPDVIRYCLAALRQSDAPPPRSPKKNEGGNAVCLPKGRIANLSPQRLMKRIHRRQTEMT
ncbi:Putative mitochondrial protein [Durusdinium trenchii]|uniref:Mitochondrial protein n=1 Tax=Durusdinium trenchii TaxID=1381693 RepID=A0ABP0LIP2_9DINO